MSNPENTSTPPLIDNPTALKESAQGLRPPKDKNKKRDVSLEQIQAALQFVNDENSEISDDILLTRELPKVLKWVESLPEGALKVRLLELLIGEPKDIRNTDMDRRRAVALAAVAMALFTEWRSSFSGVI